VMVLSVGEAGPKSTLAADAWDPLTGRLCAACGFLYGAGPALAEPLPVVALRPEHTKTPPDI